MNHPVQKPSLYHSEVSGFNFMLLHLNTERQNDSSTVINTTDCGAVTPGWAQQLIPKCGLEAVHRNIMYVPRCCNSSAPGSDERSLVIGISPDTTHAHVVRMSDVHDASI